MSNKITSLFKNQQGGGIHGSLLKNNYQKTSKAIAFLFCVIFFVFLPVGFSGVSKAEAATYYVSQSTANGYAIGNNGNNGRSMSTPKLTITEALYAVANGDTITINDGTYTEGILYITKGITINPVNNLAVTIATTGSYVIDATIPAGTTFTLGAVIIEGGGTVNGIVYQDSPAIYSAILNNTKIQNCLRAVHGSHSTRINFTANNPVVTQLSNDGSSSIIFNNLVQGGININGGTFNSTSSNTTSSTAVFIKATSPGVTASIMNMAINSTAGTVGGFAVLGTTNIANVLISGNTINISDIPGIHGAIDAIRVDSDYSNTLDASGAVIANNIITNTETGTGAAHLIIVGEDSSVLSSPLRNKVNNARIYGNTLTGGDANNVMMHGIEIGNQTGGEVYNNKIDNVYIGVIAKGQTNGLYYKNIITRATGNYLRAKASTGTLFFNNTVIITPGFAWFGILASEENSGTSIVSTGIDFRNNLIYSTTVPTRFAQVNAGSTAVFHNNGYYTPVSGVSFQYQSTIYNDINLWAQAQEPSLVFADPIFVNFASGNYALQGTSLSIDSGTPISGITTDYLGNHIYGTPDIGAYEYQPPYTITTDNPNISSPIRIYADGKYRYTNTTSGSNNAKLSITPQAGFGTGDYSQWMDVSIDTWHTSTDYYKKWTESSTNHSLVTTNTIGDLKPNTYYTLKIDTNNQDTYLSNSSGQITFTYSGGYSTHTFEITEDTTAPASFTLVSPTNNTVTSNKNPIFSWNASSDTESNLSKYQLYIDGGMDVNNIASSTNSTFPSAELSCGNHSWYIKAIDNNNNTANSNTFTLNINCAGGFISPPKPIITPTDLISGTVPSNITQIAISRTPDFTNISWQPFDKDKFKNIDQTTETLYVKFRTDQGAVSDTIIYTPKTTNQTTQTLNEGDIVKTPNNPDVYVIKYKNNKQYKRLILSPLVFKSYQHLKWENIKIISQDQLDKYTTSNLVKETIDTIIYLLFSNGDTGERKPQDTSINYDPDSVYEINATDRDSYKLVK